MVCPLFLGSLSLSVSGGLKKINKLLGLTNAVERTAIPATGEKLRK